MRPRSQGMSGLEQTIWAIACTAVLLAMSVVRPWEMTAGVGLARSGGDADSGSIGSEAPGRRALPPDQAEEGPRTAVHDGVLAAAGAPTPMAAGASERTHHATSGAATSPRAEGVEVALGSRDRPPDAGRPDGRGPGGVPMTGHVGRPHPGVAVGLLTFRGNPTRTFHGTGPIPTAVDVVWRYPASAMCSPSTVGEETREWCGTGWTGQPAVVDRDDRTWLVFGAYDRAVHFVDADTGEAILPPLRTGDIIKGSVTVDPDGHPIVYSGSRDGRYRVIAMDGDAPRELWALTAADATGPTRWNDDWDGSGLVIDDHLLIGGENSRFFVVRLHRGYDLDGRVTVDPQVVLDVAGFDDDLLAVLGDGNVSIETSVAFHEGTVYFANSGGLVQGWDLSGLLAGTTTGPPPQVLRWWMGDDVDATVVVDDDGMLYVAAEVERHTARSTEVGQVVKLDPSRPDDPLVWSAWDPALADRPEVAGVWGTPALHGEVLLVPTTRGLLLALDRTTGEERWRLSFGDHLWSSPVVVDDVLVQGDCAGALHAFDLSRAGQDAPPPALWTLPVGGCVESTPAVWEGRIYVGTRAGRMVAVGPSGTPAQPQVPRR